MLVPGSNALVAEKVDQLKARPETLSVQRTRPWPFLGRPRGR